MSSEEIASADSLLTENAQQRDYITRLRRWGSRLLKVIDTHPDLIPIYAQSLKWRIDGPPAPAETDDPSEVAMLQGELTALRAAAQLAANALFTLSYRVDLDDNTRSAIKQVQLALDTALHDAPRESTNG